MPETILKNPTQATETAPGSSWSGYANIKTSNNSHASSNLNKDAGSTYQLKGYDYEMNIPAGATITGIRICVERGANYDEGGDSITDLEIYLMKAGTPGGTNKASGTRIAGETKVYYGGDGDMWGRTWSVAEINSQWFGASTKFHQSVGGANCNVYVDWIPVKVFYTLGFGDVAKVNGIPVADIAKINGIPVADIEKIIGIT